MVRESSPIAVIALMRIPFRRSSRTRRFPWCCRSTTIAEHVIMAMRRRGEVVFPNAAGVDVGESSRWVAVPPHVTEDPVREFGAMTEDLNALAQCLAAWIRWQSNRLGVLDSGYEVLEQRGFLSVFRRLPLGCGRRRCSDDRGVRLCSRGTRRQDRSSIRRGSSGACCATNASAASRAVVASG